MQRGWFIAAALCIGAGCGDDTTSSGETDGGSTSTSDPDTVGPGESSDDASTSATSTADSGSEDATSVAASGASSSDSGSGQDASTSSTGGLSQLEAELIFYPQQPMVVDVALQGDAPLPDALALTHDFDDGVRIAVWDEPDEQTRTFRVRGLAPATKHALTATTSGITLPIAFTTEAPLPGFIPSFTVDGESSGEGPLRMFDLTPLPDFGTSSLFVVDTAGRTRFHHGVALGALPGPDSVLAAAQLRDDGTVLYVADNAVIILDELGNEVLRIDDEDVGLTGLHHDVLELDNGNFIALSNSFQTVDYPGNGPTLTAGDVIAEFTPDGELVWQWDSFDDLDPFHVTEPYDVVIPHPETGEDAYDWTHANGIILSPDGQSVMISFRHQDWMVSIDRETATMQWRLGVDGDFALQSGAWFFHQHSPQWQPDGTLMLYDNGVGPDGPQISRVVRFSLDEEAMQATQVFEDDEQLIASVFAGDADLLPRSGNILATDSAVFTLDGIVARLRELDPEASPMIVWQLFFEPGNFVYRTTANDRLVGEPL